MTQQTGYGRPADIAASPAADTVPALPTDAFRLAVASVPLVSIDFLVRDAGGRYLVGQRRNAPAQGWWFVPGGRIRKNERIAEALARLQREELGAARVGVPRFVGMFEHFYDTNFACEPGSSTHYVVMAYALELEGSAPALPADQHGAYRWLTPAELRADPGVHAYTRAYFPLE
ncbi:GDP-mannose mannosyl hydrolase [Cupriavidus pinatubonensis]|uniref:GDP-mannose mannosyl hydrolase n=1 Tax=Cupriavidus pinatubonensis TaxID=248026 RepID=A0ABN7Y9D0_9BURK|nr:GDP-mannose mannosyl hydrolase [Cupriavidus pinatubonensis]